MTELPRLLVIVEAGPSTLDTIAAAVDSGARGVVLRMRTSPDPALAASSRRLLSAVAGILILAAPGLPGPVHLAAATPFPSPRPSVVGRSCHGAAEVDRSVDEGCDYVFVSPVFPTPSKPGYGPPLGPAGLAALVRPGIATYALGGVTPALVRACRSSGAYGVAVMGPVQRDPTIVRDYLKELP